MIIMKVRISKDVHNSFFEDVYALLDTGASDTFISDNIFNRFKFEQNEEIEIELGDNSILKSISFDSFLLFENHTKFMKVRCIKMPPKNIGNMKIDLIIGENVYSHSNFEYNMGYFNFEISKLK